MPESPAVRTQNTKIVPCMVTNAKYILGSNTPPGAHFPRSISNIAKDCPGLANCNLKRADIIIPTTAINMPVIRNCLAIIL